MFHLMGGKFPKTMLIVGSYLVAFSLIMLMRNAPDQAYAQKKAQPKKPCKEIPGKVHCPPTPTPTLKGSTVKATPLPPPDVSKLEFNDGVSDAIEWNGRRASGKTRDIKDGSLLTLYNEYELEINEPVDFLIRLSCQDCQSNAKWEVHIIDQVNNKISTSSSFDPEKTSQLHGGTLTQKATYRVEVRYRGFNPATKAVRHPYSLLVTRKMTLETYLIRLKAIQGKCQNSRSEEPTRKEVVKELDTLAQQMPERPEAVQETGITAWTCEARDLARKTMEKVLDSGGTVSFDIAQNRACKEIDLSNQKNSKITSQIKLQKGKIDWPSCQNLIDELRKGARISLNILDYSSIISLSAGTGKSKDFYFASGLNNRDGAGLWLDAKFITDISNKYLLLK